MSLLSCRKRVLSLLTFIGVMVTALPLHAASTNLICKKAIADQIDAFMVLVNEIEAKCIEQNIYLANSNTLDCKNLCTQSLISTLNKGEFNIEISISSGGSSYGGSFSGSEIMGGMSSGQMPGLAASAGENSAGLPSASSPRSIPINRGPMHDLPLIKDVPKSSLTKISKEKGSALSCDLRGHGSLQNEIQMNAKAHGDDDNLTTTEQRALQLKSLEEAYRGFFLQGINYYRVSIPFSPYAATDGASIKFSITLKFKIPLGPTEQITCVNPLFSPIVNNFSSIILTSPWVVEKFQLACAGK